MVENFKGETGSRRVPGLIQLQDANGTVIIDKHALGHSEDGTTLVDVEIDLVGTRQGAFTLMIRPLGLGWRRFSVIVE
jgi:hypothetical protein